MSTVGVQSRLVYFLRMAWGGAACGFVAGIVLCAMAGYLIFALSDGVAFDVDQILLGGGSVSALGLAWGSYLGLTDSIAR